MKLTMKMTKVKNIPNKIVFLARRIYVGFLNWITMGQIKQHHSLVARFEGLLKDIEGMTNRISDMEDATDIPTTNDIEEIVADWIYNNDEWAKDSDLDDLKSEVSDLTNKIEETPEKEDVELDYCRLAQEIDYGTLSYEIDASQVAQDLDYGEIAGEIDMDAIADALSIDTGDIVDHIGADYICDEVASKIKDSIKVTID